MVYKYQVEKWILNSPYTAWAGWFGPKTRATLRNEYLAYQEQVARKEEQEALRENFKIQAYQQASTIVNNLWSPKLWQVSPQVRELQKQLAELWYFSYKDTAIFGEKTKKSILNYQIEKNIVDSSDATGAGVFWPKTQEQLKKDIQEKIFTTLVSQEPKLANNQDSLHNT